MKEVAIVRLDLAKRVFQVHGAPTEGGYIIRVQPRVIPENPALAEPPR